MWIAEDGPGQQDPLPLAAGEPAAALADDRLIALVEPLDDEPMGVGLFGGGDDLGVAGVRRAVADVVQHRVVEQRGLLGDQAGHAAEIADPQVADVDAVQPHGAVGGVVKPRRAD